METEQLEIDDETLMAFVDGELDAARARDIASQLAVDATLRARALEFEESAAWLREATEFRLRESPDPMLVARLLGEEAASDSNQAVARARRFSGLAMAASLLVGVGVGALLLYGVGVPTPESSGGADWVALDRRVGWRDGLESVPSGERFELVASGAVASDRITPLYSFVDVDDNVCRVFEREPGPAGEGDTVQGLACRNEAGDWRVRLLVAASLLSESYSAGAVQGYAPASAPTASGLQGLIAERMGSAPLSADLERDMLRNDWKLPATR